MKKNNAVCRITFFISFVLFITVTSSIAVQSASDLDARKIMEQINAQYAKRLNEPRKVEVHSTIVTKREGSPDIKVTSTTLIYQHGAKARVETVQSQVQVDADEAQGTPEYSGSGATRNLWVSSEKQILGLYESPEVSEKDGKSKTVTKVYKMDIASKEQHPLLQDEIHDAIFGCGVYCEQNKPQRKICYSACFCPSF